MRFVSRYLPAGSAVVWALMVIGSARLAGAETLSADEALRRAAASNPTLRAAALDETAAKQGVLAEEGARDPVFLASLTGSYTESTSSQTASGPSIFSDEQIEAKAALRATTDIGTQLEVGTSGDINWRGGQTAQLTLQPTYSALAYLSARQPLLKGAGTDAVLSGQWQAEASARSAELGTAATTSQTALDVLDAYWELWYAEQALAVQTSALQTANRQLEDANQRLNLGTASRVDALQFQSSAAAVRDALSQSRTARDARALELGRLLGSPADSALALRADGSLPTFSTPHELGPLVLRAEKQSPELAALRAELIASQTRLDAAEDADQPRLDLFTTLSAGLLWADDGATGLGVSGGRPAFSIVGGIELELPIGGGRASAEAARAKTQLQAAEARYLERSLGVGSRVGTLFTNAKASDNQVELAAESTRISEELAEAERQRLVLGTTSSADVVKAEQSLREAQLRELRTRVEAVKQKLELEHATGALLERFSNLFARSNP